jgi:hypothetical protein
LIELGCSGRKSGGVPAIGTPAQAGFSRETETVLAWLRVADGKMEALLHFPQPHQQTPQ